MELVATEEEATEYLEQLAFEEEEEQILLSCCFFFRGGRYRRLVCLRVMKYRAFTTRIERIKGMIGCVY